MKLYIQQVFSLWKYNFFLILILIVFMIVMYYFIPPISEAALIEYLDKKKSISYSIWKGFVNFFPMFELHWFLTLFSFLYFFIAISRICIIWMFNTTFVLPLLICWFILDVFFNLTTVYAKYLVMLEKLSPFDAIKQSIHLSFLNFKITLKWYLIYVFLYIRTILNIFILIGIPLWILYIFLKSNVFNVYIVRYTIYTIMFILFLITVYINWIVESFFIVMWYEIFKLIEK